MGNNFLELSGVGIEFNTDGKKFTALEDVNLKIGESDFITLIGHAGRGKSTVLTIIAGLHRATRGGAMILPVALKRSRDRLGLAEDKEFVHLRQQVLQFLHAKHSGVDGGAKRLKLPLVIRRRQAA